MKFALAPITYRIACLDSKPEVKGYAVQLPGKLARLHFCVRKVGRQWAVDHYESGMAAIGPVVEVGETRKTRLDYMRKWQRDGRSMDSAIFWLIRYLTHMTNAGKLRPQFRAGGYEWCLKGTRL